VFLTTFVFCAAPGVVSYLASAVRLFQQGWVSSQRQCVHVRDRFAASAGHEVLGKGLWCMPSYASTTIILMLWMTHVSQDELSNYQFQKQFLKPFEYIMGNAQVRAHLTMFCGQPPIDSCFLTTVVPQDQGPHRAVPVSHDPRPRSQRQVRLEERIHRVHHRRERGERQHCSSQLRTCVLVIRDDIFD